MSKVFRYTLGILLIALMIVCGAGCGSDKGSHVKTDYDSPAAVIRALNDGGNVVGKTVRVKAMESSSGGMIYHDEDSSLDADIYVSLISDTDIKKGDIVAVRIDSVDKQLDRGYYIFGSKQ